MIPFWNWKKFYWFDKLLFYGMQVYYRNDFLPFLFGCFSFIIGKLLQIDVYKIIHGSTKQQAEKQQPQQQQQQQWLEQQQKQ